MNMGRTLRNIKARLMDLIHGGGEKDFPWASHSGENYPREKADLQGYKPSTAENGESAEVRERNEAPRGEDDTSTSEAKVVEEGSPRDEVERGDGHGDYAATSPGNESDVRGGEHGIASPEEESASPLEAAGVGAAAPSTPAFNSGESPTAPFHLDKLPDISTLHPAPTELLDPHAPELNIPVSIPDADAETDALFSSLRQGAAGEEYFIAPADEMVRALNSYNNTLNNGTFFLEDADGVGDGGSAVK